MISDYQKKMLKAAGLRADAALLEREAFENRLLPKKWCVGQKVRYLNHSDFAWSAGSIATIIQVSDEYNVFWTRPIGCKEGRYWTTPADVELVEDVENDNA